MPVGHWSPFILSLLTLFGGLGVNGVPTTLSPKMGVVYKVVKDKVSVFGNYMNGGFNKGGVFADGNQFKPEHANQLEFGVKGDILDHRLVGSVNYYDIQVKNHLI
jgi:iron complex outermembrane receptor protein